MARQITDTYPKFSKYLWRGIPPHMRMFDYTYGSGSKSIHSALGVRRGGGSVAFMGHLYRGDFSIAKFRKAITSWPGIERPLPESMSSFAIHMAGERLVQASHHPAWFLSSQITLVENVAADIEVAARMAAFNRVMKMTELSQVGTDVSARVFTAPVDDIAERLRNTGMLSWLWRFGEDYFACKNPTLHHTGLRRWCAWADLDPDSMKDILASQIADDIALVRGFFHDDAAPTFTEIVRRRRMLTE